MNTPQGTASRRLKLPWGSMHLVTGGTGPPLVLLHGLGGSCRDFFNITPYLIKQRTLIMPDLPGFGLSDKPDAPYTMAWLGERLRELSQTLGINQAEWLGHSMGGLLCLLLASRGLVSLKRVAAVCPAGGHQGIAPLYRFLFFLLVNKDDTFRFWRPWFLDFIMNRIFAEPKMPAAQELKNRLLGQWLSPERPLLERALVRAGRGMLACPIWPELKAINAPVLIVAGNKDQVVPQDEINRIVSHLPSSAKLVTLKCGHMPPYSQPRKLAQIVMEFMQAPR